jgi:histone H3/H4
MRTGHDYMIHNDRSVSESERDFYRKVVSIMSILCEEALKSASKFAETCGRRKVSGNDTLLALKYESHEFWDKDTDDRFFQKLTEEREHTYETDEESEESEEGEESSETEEEYTTDFVAGDRHFYDRVMSIAQQWDDWQPDDPVKRLLKNAIEDTENRFTV